MTQSNPTDERLRQWAETHNMDGWNLTDLRCAYDDAASYAVLAEREEAKAKSHSEYVRKVNEGKPLPPELKPISDEAVKYANANGTILSLLYDMNLMPEQLEEGSYRWGQMINIIDHFRAALSKPTP